ncbi:MAG: transporter substrate-binding domain-containing protein [Jaaginema sp. PMC 1079.18]|nr:transporter substrate-binding domain-containing protein [Jaaginema sp. PMC 1080.18]MEC4851388.1 transporter substrate-binding domain-containing protein [Jaaginema sp. PMC 1079.18]MEC4864486.1 transporter substrate-binding domain-containing protein [Jaaginema sp. PMC 1078.18]
MRWLGYAIPLSLVPLVMATAVSAASLPEILERGRIIVGVKDNLRPLGFVGENQELQGLEIDMARQLALEWFGDRDAVEFVPLENVDRLEAVLQGEVDFAIANLAETEARSRVVHFSRHYYLSGMGLISKNPDIRGLGDLAYRKIAVLENSRAIAVIRYEIPHGQLVGVVSYQEAYQKLETGEIDAFAGDRAVLAGWLQEYPQYRLVDSFLSGEALCVALPKGLQYSGLHLMMNESISRWVQSGWLRDRLEYWDLQ